MHSPLPRKQRSRSASQIRREDAEELAAIKESLGFGRPGQSVAKGKVFPESTDDFFDAIGRWWVEGGGEGWGAGSNV